MKVVRFDQSIGKQITRNGTVGWARQYFGQARRIEPGPQGFLVENPAAGSTIAAHFHDTDQFQVVVEGGGKLGGKPVKPIAFHYADAFTPYGPIIAGDEGISFFSLRPAAVGGIFYVPAARHLMPARPGQKPGRPGRNLLGLFDISQPLPTAGEARRETLIEREPDGVEAIGLHLGPGASAPGLAPQGAGQYFLVCSGSIVAEGLVAPFKSTGYVEADSETPVFQAGPDGARVLIMQFPRGSDRPGSDVSKMAHRDPESYVAIS